MRNVRTFVTINGEIHGSIWQPGFHCYKPVNTRVEIIHGADSLPYKGIGLPRQWQSSSVQAALAEVLNDGDFQNATFTPDTEIAIERVRAMPGGLIESRPNLRVQVPAHTFTRRREIKLSADYVSECDGHDYDGD